MGVPRLMTRLHEAAFEAIGSGVSNGKITASEFDKIKANIPTGFFVLENKEDGRGVVAYFDSITNTFQALIKE